jgi:hypothetical protein
MTRAMAPAARSSGSIWPEGSKHGTNQVLHIPLCLDILFDVLFEHVVDHLTQQSGPEGAESTIPPPASDLISLGIGSPLR